MHPVEGAVQDVEAVPPQGARVLVLREPRAGKRLLVALEPDLRMLTTQPAHRAQRPEPVVPRGVRWVRALEERAVEGEHATWDQDAGDLPKRLILVVHEMNGVAEEQGIDRAPESSGRS